MGLIANDDNKIVFGYVFFIRAYSTADNPTYDGVVNIYYGGAKKTILGHDGFEPYKTEKSAERGRKAWEKWFEMVDAVDDAWRHQVGGIMPVTESMYEDMEKQFEKNCEIVRNNKSPMMERLAESIEKESRRMNFRVIK